MRVVASWRHGRVCVVQNDFRLHAPRRRLAFEGRTRDSGPPEKSLCSTHIARPSPRGKEIRSDGGVTARSIFWASKCEEKVRDQVKESPRKRAPRVGEFVSGRRKAEEKSTFGSTKSSGNLWFMKLLEESLCSSGAGLLVERPVS